MSEGHMGAAVLLVADWVRRTFGASAMAPAERATRLLEEAIELAQVEGATVDFVRRLVEEVYSRDRGKAEQEAGGVALTFAAYCATKQFDPDEVLLQELRRVLDKPAAVFRNRNDQKIQHGLSMSNKKIIT
jgi:hypothetical protein